MPHIPVKIPDTMSRNDVGPYLSGLRKHFGLSEQDVSDRLHIRVRYVRAIEIGDFAQLPTVVYARGYLHTYAEFLGLDADQVVERCFGEEVATSPLPILPQASSARGSIHAAQWRGGAVMAIVAAIVILVAAQFYGHHRHDAPEPVAAVPDEVLEVMRTMVMPTGPSRDCLNGDGWASCMLATRHWKWLAHVQNPSMHFEAELLLSPFAVALTLPTTPPLVDDVAPDAAAKAEKKLSKAKPANAAEQTEEPAEHAR